MKELKLPQGDISLHCSDILDKAPMVIADVQGDLGKAITNLKRIKAVVALNNKSEKQSVIKSIVDTDKGVITMEDEVTDLQVNYDLWKHAQSAARAFHKEQTCG